MFSFQVLTEREKETNTHNFFSLDLADPHHLLPIVVCFWSSIVFFEFFFVYFFLIRVPITSAYLTINIRLK